MHACIRSWLIVHSSIGSTDTETETVTKTETDTGTMQETLKDMRGLVLAQGSENMRQDENIPKSPELKTRDKRKTINIRKENNERAS